MKNVTESQLALELGGVGIWERDLRTDIVNISSAMAMLVGVPTGQNKLTAEEWQNLVLPEDLPVLAQSLEASLSSKHPFDLEFRIRRADGLIVSMVSRGSIIYNQENVPEKAIGICFLNKNSRHLLEEATDPNRKTLKARASAKNALLTKQQRAVIQCIASGKNVRETASLLNITEDTVRHHQREVRNRLGAKTVTHAMTLAVQLGFV